LVAYTARTLERIQVAGQGGYAIELGQTIDGVSVRTLRAKYGSPLYIVSEGALRTNIRHFLLAFRSRYPETVVAYSYKTNYVAGVCAILHQEGAWAEVVSGFEMEHARALGVPGPQVIYNGPHKPFEYLLEAGRQGARVNADSLEELSDLEEVARRLRRPVKIGVRVNMRLTDTPWDKFGFNLESGQALEVCGRIHASKRLRLSGFHLHAGTRLADVEIYRAAIEGLLELARTVDSPRLGEIEYLDLGGGFVSDNTILGQAVSEDVTAPSFDAYAEAICGPLNARMKGLRRRPLLILEPGRAIVESPVSLLVSVVAVKRTPEGRKLVVVDGGVNLLPAAHRFRHEVAAGGRGAARAENADIVGALCMQDDVLRRDVPLPPVSRGSILVFGHAGAYTISHSTQFIYPRPPVVLVRGRQTYVLRRGERTEDLVRLDEIPPHLATAPAVRGNGRSRRTASSPGARR